MKKCLAFTISQTLIFLLSVPVKAQTTNDNGASSNVNDTLLELFHECKCTLYVQCEEINDFIVNRSKFFDKPVNCTDPNYLCCEVSEKERERGKPEEPVAETTEKPLEITTKSTVPPKTSATTTEKLETSFRFTSEKAGCGKPRTSLNVRILNPDTDSASTVLGEVPWIVEIFQQTSSQKYKFKCAGSLIHPKVVLTATHCVKSSKEKALKIIATGKEMFQNVGENTENEKDVEKIIIHPEYYSGGLYNDIALIILQEEYKYSTHPLNAICLPDQDRVFDGKICLAVGWGQNLDHAAIPLKKVDVPIVSFERCQNLLRKTRLSDRFNLHSSFICAGGEEGKDTCKGDGGSPLICLDDDFTHYIQAGIVSWGVDNMCGIVDQPGLYTNVAKFRGWITEELKKYNIPI